LTPEQVWQVQEGRLFVDALPVRAPLDGFVVRSAATLGRAVKAEEALFEVHDLSRPIVRAHVGQRQVAAAWVGQKARACLLAAPDREAEAAVVRSAQALGDGDRALALWAELRQPPGPRWLPGMLVRLTLVLDEPPPTLAVPRSAVLREGG